MITIDGARLLGRERELGSIEIGKRADLVVVRMDGVQVAPAWDPISTLVYASGARDVEHVLIDGKPVVERGQLLTLDAERVARQAKSEARRLARRAGL